MSACATSGAPLSMRKVSERSEIFPVFHDLFQRRDSGQEKAAAMTRHDGRLFEGADWDFRTLQRIHDACEEIASNELGLDVYPNQIEVITAEQMLDAYSSSACRCSTSTGRSASISRITRRSIARA